MSKNKENNAIIMKHVFEVRLRKRIFSFLDFKGEFLDFLINELKRDKIRVTNNGTRIDISNDDLTNIFFVSYENFGFQLEGSDSFDGFSEQIDRILELIKSYPKYKFDSVVRVGTRSFILCHNKGDNFTVLKQKYKELLFNNYESIESNIKGTLADFAYSFKVSKDSGDANVITGPVTKDEAIIRFLGENKCYEKFNHKDGFFFDIDFSKNGDKLISNIDDLGNDAKDNIKNIKEILDGFLKYFNSENNG